MKKIIFSLAMLAAVASANAATPMVPTVNSVEMTAAAPTAGQPVDFTLKDLSGKAFKLSSLKGKYVIVDFWGTWCINCIKGFPKMKEYYAAHKNKLAVVSVDCNDTDARWKAGVKKHGLPWVNVYNPKGAGDITKKLGVTAFPTKLLINPQGKLVKAFVGETDDLYTELNKLLK
jgi:thiol-disulfide isomerase/thioredoxin